MPVPFYSYMSSCGGIAKRQDFVVNRSAILTAEEAGDEGGLMKCMFHVEDRHQICVVLVSEEKDEFFQALKVALSVEDLGAESEAC